jgi:hypothetical protein
MTTSERVSAVTNTSQATALRPSSLLCRVAHGCTRYFHGLPLLTDTNRVQSPNPKKTAISTMSRHTTPRTPGQAAATVFGEERRIDPRWPSDL